jgi:hypothetical protein
MFILVVHATCTTIAAIQHMNGGGVDVQCCTHCVRAPRPEPAHRSPSLAHATGVDLAAGHHHTDEKVIKPQVNGSAARCWPCARQRCCTHTGTKQDCEDRGYCGSGPRPLYALHACHGPGSLRTHTYSAYKNTCRSESVPDAQEKRSSGAFDAVQTARAGKKVFLTRGTVPAPPSALLALPHYRTPMTHPYTCVNMYIDGQMALIRLGKRAGACARQPEKRLQTIQAARNQRSSSRAATGALRGILMQLDMIGHHIHMLHMMYEEYGHCARGSRALGVRHARDHQLQAEKKFSQPRGSAPRVRTHSATVTTPGPHKSYSNVGK